MAFTLFGSIQDWLKSLCRGAKQRLRQWTRPDNSNDSLAVGIALDLTRSKSELVLENALLRQQLIVLRRQVKRPPLTWRDRALFVLIASKLPSQGGDHLSASSGRLALRLSAANSRETLAASRCLSIWRGGSFLPQAKSYTTAYDESAYTEGSWSIRGALMG